MEENDVLSINEHEANDSLCVSKLFSLSALTYVIKKVSTHYKKGYCMW